LVYIRGTPQVLKGSSDQDTWDYDTLLDIYDHLRKSECHTHHRPHTGRRLLCSIATLLHQSHRRLLSSRLPPRQHQSPRQTKSEGLSFGLPAMLVLLQRSNATRSIQSALAAWPMDHSAFTASRGSMASLAARGRGTQTARHSSRPQSSDLRQMAASLANSESDLIQSCSHCQTFPKPSQTGPRTGLRHLVCQGHQTCPLSLR
jgi:hypothetical protein